MFIMYFGVFIFRFVFRWSFFFFVLDWLSLMVFCMIFFSFSGLDFRLILLVLIFERLRILLMIVRRLLLAMEMVFRYFC